MNRKDQKDLLSLGKTPVPLPSANEAWSNMQLKLDDEMQDRAPAFNSANNLGAISDWRLKASLVLVLLVFTLIVGIQPGKKTRSNKVPVPRMQHGFGLQRNNPPINSSAALSKDDPLKTVDTILTKSDAKDFEDRLKQYLFTEEFTDNPSTGNNSNVKNIDSRIDQDNKPLITENTSLVGQPNDAPTTENGQKNQDIQQQPSLNFASPDSTLKIPPPDKVIANDSTENLAEASDQEEQEHSTITAGLQWNVQMPISGTSNYFSGPNAKSQPYGLLPGAWFSVQTETFLLKLDVNPFFTTVLPDKPFGTFTNVENISDTLVTITQTKAVRKLFGTAAGLGFLQKVSGKWWMGGNLRGFWWKKAVATRSGYIEKQAIANPGKTSQSFNNSYTITKDDWLYINKFQLTLDAELLYMQQQWQAGVRMGIPLNPLSKNEGPSNTLRAELIFKVPLWRMKK